jgi:CRP-like cAMP-binding protein
MSVVSETGEGLSVEVATIGREGIMGASVFLGSSPLPLRSICQISGEALGGSTADLVAEFGQSSLRTLVLQYTQTMLVQASVTASCNRLHPLEQRAARWLLTVGDRLGRPKFELTHDFFAVLLGSHRPSVSLAAQMLAKGGLISYRRGELEILDPAGLADAACECYGIINEHFEQAMGYRLGQTQHR